jgi:phi LC3 family holin
MFDIFPTVTQNTVIQIIDNVLLFLSMIGVITDPTTAGLNDSERAMNYTEPWSDG